MNMPYIMCEKIFLLYVPKEENMNGLPIYTTPYEIMDVNLALKKMSIKYADHYNIVIKKIRYIEKHK